MNRRDEQTKVRYDRTRGYPRVATRNAGILNLTHCTRARARDGFFPGGIPPSSMPSSGNRIPEFMEQNFRKMETLPPCHREPFTPPTVRIACRRIIRKRTRTSLLVSVFFHCRRLPDGANSAKSITHSARCNAERAMTNIPLTRVPSCATTAIG